MSFTFKQVELFKQQTLGTGAYGAVCKAKCDDLPCAAKLLYPILFDLNDQPAPSRGREHRLPFRRFEQECQFLSQVKHPNIVQYLGTYRDPDTGAPALIMELMDENLTFFLERQQAPVPLHIQINLLHDIALALAYLHSNRIIHRDLSSNNVLLIASSRAKVTDFGMSSLVDIASPKMATLTTCPGTQAYMPPEALNEPPVYSEKLDCFSFGVLIVQVLTRQFPNPSKRFRTVEVCDPDNRSIKFQAQVPVPEVERRESHINLIKESTLLPTAIECLSDYSTRRPTASELCQRLATLKENNPSYHRSMQEYQDVHKSFLTKQQQLLDKEQELIRISKLLSNKDCEIEQLNTRLQELELNKKLADYEQRKAALKVLLTEDQSREKSLTTTEKPHSKHDDIEWTQGPSAPIKMDGGTSTHDGNVAYFAPQGSQSVYQFDPREEQWTKLTPCPHSNITIVMVNQLLTTVGGHKFGTGISNKLYSYVKEKWVEVFPPMPTKRFAVAAVSNKRVLVVAGGFGHENKKLPTVEMLDINAHQWYSVSPLKFGICEASAVIVGGRVHVGGGYSHKVHEYRVMACSLQTLLKPDSEWEFTATLPVNRATLATTGGKLLAFGGSTSNVIYSYNADKDFWEDMSSFSRARANPLVAALPTHLIVVGGNGYNREVEVGIPADPTSNCSVM